ncbi:AAA family ATPase [Vibrio sp. Vb2235]|uniref:AAA family ATPase n=1 Tax=Vibrio TaxID=662 RepID=UPI002963E39D|nr:MULTISPECIES: AAA family ATPase [unclassified Vibrio]MDW1732554.1 AAA family ATPase [Vibrio sp. Vb2235]MDW1784825.1 AAA family ATPase [Vibrio sp. Vb2227]MDW1814457.1 AAA family ATPase [Vibrio sp. Vb2232]MDW2163707.1 AAA family ATPase [Vibrio sp. 2099]
MKLIEKYAPKTLDELVLNEAAHRLVSKYLEDDSALDNLIFHSQENGTGKTSAARMIAEKWSKSVFSEFTEQREAILEYKGSQFGTGDVSALEKTLSMNGKRVIIINEVDRMSTQALNNLSETIDEFTKSDSNTFIMTTNRFEKLPSILTSRCQEVDFTPNGTEEGVIKRLIHIFKQEKGEPTERDITVIQDIVGKQRGSIRQSIIELGKYITINESSLMVNTECDDLDSIRTKMKEYKEAMERLASKEEQILQEQMEGCFDSALESIKDYKIEQFIEYLVEKGVYSIESKEKKEQKSTAKRESKTGGNYYYFKDENGKEHFLNTMASKTIKVTEPWRTLVKETVIENGNHVRGIQDHLIRFVKEEGGKYTFWTDATLGGAEDPNDEGAIETKFNGLKVKTIESIKLDLVKPESEAA